MHAFPHRYAVNALAAATGVVTLRGAELEDIQSTAPPEFDGPPGNWSPETLLLASIADCFVLSFRAIAQASRLAWVEIDVGATGTLDRSADGMQFSAFELNVRLRVAPGTDAARAERLLEKAEHSCPIARSLKSKVALKIQVVS